jgi:hypothetical protein
MKKSAIKIYDAYGLWRVMRVKDTLSIFLVLFLGILLQGCYVTDTDSEASAHRTRNRIDMACGSIEIYREDHGSFPEAKKWS